MFVIQPWGAADFLILCNHFLREALTARIDTDLLHLGNQTRVAVVCLYDEELAAVGGRTCICHRQCTAEVAQLNVEFILERSSPDAFAAHAGAFRVAALNHKAVDDAVEADTVIVTLFCMGHKVFDCLWCFFREQSHLDGSHVGLHYDYFAVLCRFFKLIHCFSSSE